MVIGLLKRAANPLPMENHLQGCNLPDFCGSEEGCVASISQLDGCVSGALWRRSVVHVRAHRVLQKISIL